MATRNILIVDDEVELREIIAEAFQLSGWEVTTTANGVEALDVLGKLGPFEAMLADVKMPIMDGQELLKQIKARGLKIPHIYLMTGFSSLSLLEAQEIGAKELFRKPFDPFQLCQTIEAELRAKS